MDRFGFGPASADELIVFGAQRPGYPGKNVEKSDVDTWIGFMADNEIRRVVCLLEQEQLKFYSSLPNGLLDLYKGKEQFGRDKVLPAPICDYHLSEPENLKRILEFLTKASKEREKVVVHCSGGSGRTGHVLAAWLVRARGCGPEQALKAVEQMGRNPKEAVHCRNATKEDLMRLLAGCRP